MIRTHCLTCTVQWQEFAYYSLSIYDWNFFSFGFEMSIGDPTYIFNKTIIFCYYFISFHIVIVVCINCHSNLLMIHTSHSNHTCAKYMAEYMVDWYECIIDNMNIMCAVTFDIMIRHLRRLVGCIWSDCNQTYAINNLMLLFIDTMFIRNNRMPERMHVTQA